MNFAIDVFYPFSPMHNPFEVAFVEYKATQEGFHDIMVVSYNDHNYELKWDEYNSYYVGNIKYNGKILEGYIT